MPIIPPHLNSTATLSCEICIIELFADLVLHNANIIVLTYF